MTDQNELIKALGQVPELIETTNRILEDNDQKFRILSEAALKRAQAEIPASELAKVTDAVVKGVASTRCATPDASEVSHLVAGDIHKVLSASIKSLTTDAVKEAVADTPIKVEHFHTHSTMGYMLHEADVFIRNWIIVLSIYSVILTFGGIFLGVSYYTGEQYLGTEYFKVFCSDYITKEEKKMLRDDTYTVSALPQEFKQYPDLVRFKIKRNKEILKQRKFESDNHGGQYSTTTPLER